MLHRLFRNPPAHRGAVLSARLVASLFFAATIGLVGSLSGSSLAAEAGIQGNAADHRITRLDATWTLKDYRGGDIDAAAFAGRPLVFAFLGTECPLAKLYARRLDEIHQKYATRGVEVIAVMSNQQDSLSDVAAFVKRQQIGFRVTVDPGAKFADIIGAERTPEVFLFDAQRTLRYSGRVDDQYAIGTVREQPTSNDLSSAIKCVLDGNPVLVPRTEAIGCIIGRPKKTTDSPTVTYAGHIAPLLAAHCVACHRDGDIGPFAMTDYQEVAGWAEMIAEVARQRRMPPWHASPNHGKFANENRLTEKQIELLSQWVEQGAPLGDATRVPDVPTFAQGWAAKRAPDLVLDVTDSPVPIQADGEIKYRYYKVKTGLKEDRWVANAQFLPGNRAVVHHILAFTKDPDSPRRFNAERGFFTGYVPGMRPTQWPHGYAKRLPAGSELVFQVHYTPIGSPQSDQSKLGLWFVDEAEVTHEVFTSSAVQTRLQIPPGDPDYVTDATAPDRFNQGAELLAFSPHMHVRGKAFRYELIGDGSKTTLLDIPVYDFNWQTQYQLADPLALHPGEKIHCTAHFDNSADNLANPDPNRLVTWGDQTWDEMMIGYFHWAAPRNQPSSAHTSVPQASASKDPSDDSPAATRALAKRNIQSRLMKRMDKNGDGKLQHSEVPKQHHATFERLDTNGDNIVTPAELQNL